MRNVTLKTVKIEPLGALYKSALHNRPGKLRHCLLLIRQKQRIPNLSEVFMTSRRTIGRWSDDLSVSGVDFLHNLPAKGINIRLKGHEEVITKQLQLYSRNIKNVLLYFEGNNSKNAYRMS